MATVDVRGWWLGGVLAAATACGHAPEAPAGTPPMGDAGADAAARDTVPAITGASWPEADALFRADPRWLGGDGALSVPLGGDRALWLFGDSFVAKTPANVRRESELVRNTLAIQEGMDPTSAKMTFVWRTDPDGSPGPFFADEGALWFWPGHGVRLAEGPLVLFLMAVRSTQGEGLGFREAGYRVVVVDDPDAPPLDWAIHVHAPGGPAADPNASLGTAVERDGPWLYAYATALGSRHVGWLARFAVDAVLAGAPVPQWKSGDDRFVDAATLGERAPDTVIDTIGPENSVHEDPRLGKVVHVASRGFGATRIAVRTAPGWTGPFSAPADVFTPPESRGERPFVYAGKAHPELVTGDPNDLVVTYATNSFEFDDLFTDAGQYLYYPRFVRLRLGARE